MAQGNRNANHVLGNFGNKSATELRPDLDLPETPHDGATPPATPAPSSEADPVAPLLQLPLQAARDLVMEQFERCAPKGPSPPGFVASAR